MSYQEEAICQEKYSHTLDKWAKRCLRGARAHYFASEKAFTWGRRLTILNSVLSILILFLSNADWFFELISTDLDTKIYRLWISLSALFLVLTTILQYVFRPDEKGQYHKDAGVKFSNLQRKIERYLCYKNIPMEILHNLNREYNHITGSYPLVSMNVWNNNGLKDMSTEIFDEEINGEKNHQYGKSNITNINK